MRNITTIGSLTITDGVASGFSTSSYILLPQVFDVSKGQNWEMVFKFTTGDDVTSQCGIASGMIKPCFSWCIQNGKTQCNVGDGTDWLVASTDIYGSTTISTNTTYWMKVNFNGSQIRVYLSINGPTYNLVWSYTTSKTIPACNIVLGQGRALSLTNVPTSIDLNESYIKIDDKVWWSGKEFNLYTFKHRKQKYYKNVEVEGDTYACFVSEGGYYKYLKVPYQIDDKVYQEGSTTGSQTPSTSTSDLKIPTLSAQKLLEIYDDGTVGIGSGLLGTSPTVITPQPQYNLVEIITEQVESTKDDYDVVENLGESYHVLKTKKSTTGVIYKSYTDYDGLYWYAKMPVFAGDDIYEGTGDIVTDASELYESISIKSINTDGTIILEDGLELTPANDGDILGTIEEGVKTYSIQRRK